jgi:hypothetical protein
MGIAAGWITFAAYGMAVAPHDFIYDHLQEHLRDRFRLQDLRMAGASREGVERARITYLSIAGVWREFADHLGWIAAGLGAVALAWCVRRIRGPEGLMLLWVVGGGLLFSLMDWRMTKHLALLIPAIVAAIGFFWGSRGPRARAVVGVVVAAALVWNLWRTGHLMADFRYLRPTPLW